jgi:preprotein translocase subunit YajC
MDMIIGWDYKSHPVHYQLLSYTKVGDEVGRIGGLYIRMKKITEK